ncbi:MAG TPA: hypothetical protein VHA82_21335, partial [Ramlibacter sp.]|nr:hypothetical protein [Ramlibacter sp.]
MSSVRPVSPGKTRTCPHCKAVILESASVCPGCQHHLRFGGDAGPKVETRTALQVEGKIRHPPQEDPWEYTVVVFVRNERGEEIARYVINVGALANAEERVVSLQVEVMPPRPAVLPAPKPVFGSQSPLASSRQPLVTPPPAAAKASAPTPPHQPLRPAKETLNPPKPGDPYPSTFGRGPKTR